MDFVLAVSGWGVGNGCCRGDDGGEGLKTEGYEESKTAGAFLFVRPILVLNHNAAQTFARRQMRVAALNLPFRWKADSCSMGCRECQGRGAWPL